ncbi:hypothetical protein [Synechococcus sp. UW179B]|nr:hypothetical protein [Synechococcus sp. UW179B]
MDWPSVLIAIRLRVFSGSFSSRVWVCGGSDLTLQQGTLERFFGRL